MTVTARRPGPTRRADSRSLPRYPTALPRPYRPVIWVGRLAARAGFLVHAKPFAARGANPLFRFLGDECVHAPVPDACDILVYVHAVFQGIAFAQAFHSGAGVLRASPAQFAFACLFRAQPDLAVRAVGGLSAGAVTPRAGILFPEESRAQGTVYAAGRNVGAFHGSRVKRMTRTVKHSGRVRERGTEHG